MIKAIIFDLDDTIYPEIEYVKSGFKAIGKAFKDESLAEKLFTLFQENPVDVYQRAGFSESECQKCIEIYRKHIPDLVLREDYANVFKKLRKDGIKLGIITDGRPEGQWNKIRALKLDDFMDEIIVTDELGGIEYRKPNPKAYQIMKEKLGVKYNEMMYIGDNPKKDFTAPKFLDMKFCYIHNKSGLYADNDFSTELEIHTLSDILDLIVRL